MGFTAALKIWCSRLMQPLKRVAGYTFNMLPSFANFQTLQSGEFWRAVSFLSLNSFLGIFWGFTLFTLITLGGGLAYTLVGVAILVATMGLWRLGAKLERYRLGLFLGVRIAQPYRRAAQLGRLSRIFAPVADPATWRDLLYLLLLFPFGVVQGLSVIVVPALFIGCLSAVMYAPYYYFTTGRLPEALASYLGGGLGAGLIGLLLLCWLPPFILLLARSHANLGQALLGPTRAQLLSDDLEELRQSRTRLLDAALQERQRIERDLHDGAQQRLVAVALDLGMAREKLKTDPASAVALVEAAHEQTKQAIRDIRNLVRGIHPAVLSDRGLDPAISALAQYCPVPVTLYLALNRRFSPVVEATAYFVISEALTNLAKHSDASRVWVRGYYKAGKLFIEVQDDGRGGARFTPGGGLVGLQDRVQALDGRLLLESPAGGPTVLPCE
jgi:signal transduction histidine kinase